MPKLERYNAWSKPPIYIGKREKDREGEEKGERAQIIDITSLNITFFNKDHGLILSISFN